METELQTRRRLSRTKGTLRIMEDNPWNQTRKRFFKGQRIDMTERTPTDTKTTFDYLRTTERYPMKSNTGRISFRDTKEPIRMTENTKTTLRNKGTTQITGRWPMKSNTTRILQDIKNRYEREKKPWQQNAETTFHEPRGHHESCSDNPRNQTQKGILKDKEPIQMGGQPMKTQTRRPKTLLENQRDITNHGKTTHEPKHATDFSRRTIHENRHTYDFREPLDRYQLWEDNPWE